MRRYFPKRIIVDPAVRDMPMTRRVLERCPDVPVEVTEHARQPEDLSEGKQTLFITRPMGEFVKPCPATRRYLCCNYHILDFCSHCAMDCTYCVLQSYFSSPVMTLCADVGRLLEALQGFLARNPKGRFRIGTGEFTDSLALEHLTGFHAQIMPFFLGEERAVLEIKTKTDNIDGLLSTDPGGKVITAWSLNPPAVIQREEFRVASLSERLDAARRCQEGGYLLAFHLDPIIRYPGWEGDYRSVIERLFEEVDPGRVAYVSMGCLRFMPGLKPVVEKRFPGTKILYEEFVRGEDGKFRYLKPLRIETYSRMLSWIRAAAPEVTVYCCMEREDVWKRVFGAAPVDSEELNAMLLRGWERARRHARSPEPSCPDVEAVC